MLQPLLLSAIFFCLATRAALAWFTIPPGAGITTVLGSADNQFCWYAGPADQQEWLINKGANASIRIKGWQDVTGLKLNLAAYRGQRVVAAELHLARSNTDPVTSLVGATINTDWAESNACWRYRATPSTEWTFTNSDFSAATFGNYGSLVSFGFTNAGTFRAYTNGANTWIAMVLDPALIQALILDQYGLAVTDPRLHLQIPGNPTIHTREAGATVQPRLFIQFATNTDFTAPSAITNLTAIPGEDNGSVILQFSAPSDPDDTRAFGYNVRYSSGPVFATATNLPRWRIPRPFAPGTTQRLLLENLAPATPYTFFVQAYDAIGNSNTPASIAFTLPTPSYIPSLSNNLLPTPNPAGRTVRTVASLMRYFGASEVAQINPSTGNTIEDGYTSSNSNNYKLANMVWDSASNTLFLAGCRNEIVGAQLILQRLGASLAGLSVTVSDLAAPGGLTLPSATNIECFQMHYVTSGVSAYAEAAIPLAAPFPTTFSIPDPNHNPGGVYQSVYLDIFIPPATAAATYTGAIAIVGASLGANSPVRLGLQLRVSSVTIPDTLSFLIDLNGYGNPWDFGANVTNTCRQYYQTLRKHRATPNTLPYSWNGSVNSDRAPTLTGNGPTRAASSWTAFDAKYGGLFSTNPAQSIFNAAHGYTGPGINIPVTHFYTPFNEMWPQSMLDTTYGFDAAGAGPAYWDGLRSSANYSNLFTFCPDVRAAFPAGYRQANINIMSNWIAHAAANGWTRTAFENYLNNKFTYTGTHSLWVLEESETADDFRAVGFFHELWRDGITASGITNVPWRLRMDISDRWGQHYGELDNRINWFCMGSGAAGWHWPSKKYRTFTLNPARQEDWIWYGLGAPVAGAATENARALLQKWCQGFNGGLPYWDSFNTQWFNADDATPCVVYSGQSVPGFGLYNGPIISRRVKELRQAQQIIELLNLWSACRGMNRSRVRQSLNTRYGDHTWDYAFTNLNEVSLYQLRAALVAQLETQPAPLSFAQIVNTTNQSIVLYWPAQSNCTYSILRSTNLVTTPFLSITSGLPAHPALTIYTAASPPSISSAFYRLAEQWY